MIELTVKRAMSDPIMAIVRAWADEEIMFATYLLGRSCAASPDLEKILAMASIGQDEFGHAELLLNLLVPNPSSRRDRERYFFERGPSDFRICGLLKLELLDDWAMFVARAFLYEEAEGVRLRWLAQRPQLADVVAAMAREEEEHRRYWRWWISALAKHPEARERLGAALAHLSPYVGDVLWAEDGAPSWDPLTLRKQWADEVSSFLLPLKVPDVEALIARMGEEPGPSPEVPSFTKFIREQQRIYRSDPEAVTWG
jgi:1,2-phenylacetyl-CoA epoxidase catalytic subunit